MLTKEDRKNAYLYCRFRDRQIALYDAYAKENGMLMNTLLVTNVLYYAKAPMTQRDICSRTFLSKQTVNLIIGKLLKEAYVTVQDSSESRREKLVEMTDSGRTYCEKVVRHITRAEDTAMSMLSAEEQQTLVGLSRKFTDNLELLMQQETEE